MKRVEKLARTNKEIINHSKRSFIAGFKEGYKQSKSEENVAILRKGDYNV